MLFLCNYIINIRIICLTYNLHIKGVIEIKDRVIKLKNFLKLFIIISPFLYFIYF